MGFSTLRVNSSASGRPADERRKNLCPLTRSLRPVAYVLTSLLLGVAVFLSRAGDRALPARAAASPPRQSQKGNGDAGATLRLDIVEDATGKWTPARFTLVVDGRDYFPLQIGEHGLRFVSVHEAKRQRFVVTYAQGTGTVEVPLPAETHRVEAHAAKGFEFLPVSETAAPTDDEVRLRLKLRRWADFAANGWLPADEHVHYDRLAAEDDGDWLKMLAGDGLAHAHFMVLKGGKVPGVWARQYGYGKQGEASDGRRWIRSGEEYRDSAQGHVNLLGIDEVIPPISTGGLGKPPVPYTYPPLRDVLLRARQRGGLAGVAHGGSLGRRPTALADTVLGAVDFFEIGNAHLYALDLWYRLMNCGFNLPPAAGTDLPNYPNREYWQPFLGSMRMYVRLAGRRDFASWKRAVKGGRVFVTSGPLLTFSVNGAGPGGTIHLPEGGGVVDVEGELASPIGLQKLELVKNGRTRSVAVRRLRRDGVHRWQIRETLRVSESCWLAMRGEGVSIPALADSIGNQRPWIKTEAVAHSAAVRVIVGDKPIRSAADARFLADLLRRQREYYRTQGVYKDPQHRLNMLELFDEAVRALAER